METIDEMKQFENSFKGLINIILDRKLYKKKPYVISGITVFLINIIFLLCKDIITQKDYFDILKIFVSTFLPAFITFCGFTMTAYSLVVGFLNYGVFKTTIEKWYRIKINQTNSGVNSPQFSLYQNGIALFALAILILLFTVSFFLIIKFVIDLNIEIESGCIDHFNALIFLFVTLLSNFSIILMFYNIVNIFTFSQSLNQLVYYEELEKVNKEREEKEKKSRCFSLFKKKE